MGPLVICNLKSCFVAGFLSALPPRSRRRRRPAMSRCVWGHTAAAAEEIRGSATPNGCWLVRRVAWRATWIKWSLTLPFRLPVLFLTPARGTRLRLSASSLFLRFAVRPSRLIVCISAPPLACRRGARALQVLTGADLLSTCGAPVLEWRRALAELRRTWATSRSVDKDGRRFLSSSSSVLLTSRGAEGGSGRQIYDLEVLRQWKC